MDMLGKRVFITGITSPVGSEIAGLLMKAGGEVAGLVRNKTGSYPNLENVEIIEGDCENPKSYRKQIQSSDFIVHIAGLHLSSEIIRSCAGHDHYPDHLLSVTELTGKSMLLEKERDISTSLLPWTILRPTLIYSSGDRSFSRVRRFMATRRAFPVPGNGKATRQPISARDLAVSTVNVLLSPATHQKKYNVPGEKISVRKILEILGEEMGLDVKLINVPELPVKMLKRTCELFGFDKYGASLTSFMRWYHAFDWPGGAAADDFAHSPRSFRQNVREQIAGEGARRKTLR